MTLRLAAACLALCVLGVPPALAHSYSFEGFQVGHLWSPPPADGEEGVAVYGPLLNTGTEPLEVISVWSPQAADARFRLVTDGEVTWPAHLVLDPGKPLGLAEWLEHIWLEGLVRQMLPGDTIDLVLELSDGRRLDVESMVEAEPGE